jgi:predicted nucleic acid-binding protein
MAKMRPDIRVMLDANVLIAGSVWPRWPYEVLQHALSGGFQLVLSPYVIAQAEAQIAKSFPDNAWRFRQLIEGSNFELVQNPTKQQIKELLV